MVVVDLHTDVDEPDEREWREVLRATAFEVLWDLDALERDGATADMIRRGETMGCFYIESPSMRALFRRMHCRNYEDVVAASSIIRPGVAESGMMKAYIERRRDARKIKHLHPALGELLAETYGVMVYQEDVIKVVSALGGFTLGEADLLRRAMSGKTRGREAFASMTERFFEGCRKRAIPDATIREIWRQIESFAGYSFCKGHSAAFAVLSYQMAYLKAHHPAELMAAVLSNGGSYYGPAAYIQECRRMGLRVLGPDVNESRVDYTGRSEPREGQRPGGWVRVGFGAIKNFPLEVARRILRARRERAFEGLEDFVRRVDPGPEAAEKLIRVGGFDRFGVSRERSVLDLDLYFRTRGERGSEQLDWDWDARQVAERGAEYPAKIEEKDRPAAGGTGVAGADEFAKRMEDEIELFGYGVCGHPLELLPPEAWRDTIAARDMELFVGRRATMIGWRISAKLIRTRKSREFMKFLSLEDLTGTYEATFFPKAYRKFASLTVGLGPFRITGKVEDDLGAVSLVAEEVEVIKAD